jgi:GntR family transcriptional regulator, rspAB operon transcriptional repressor
MNHLARIDRTQMAAPQVYRYLHDQIVSGEFRPGHALSENAVADQLNVSRTPVRQAFIRLADEGLVRVFPQVGTRVSSISLAAVGDSQFLRESIECRTIAEAARRATASHRLELQRMIERQRACVHAQDGKGFFPLDEELHQYLLGMGQRQRLWRVLSDAKSQLDRVRHPSLEDPHWLRKVFKEHEGIVRRVLANDAAGAAEAMQTHLRSVFDAVQKIAAANREYFSDED